MLFTADMKDLMRLFDEHDVEYVLVGDFAVNLLRIRQNDPGYRSADLAVARQRAACHAALADFGFGGGHS